MLDIENYQMGTLVMKAKAPESVVNTLYNEAKEELYSYNHKLAGHLKSQFLFNDKTKEWFYPEMQMYWDCYREQQCYFQGKENIKLNYKAIDLWVNFMKPGDFNPIHTHGGDISFVLFLDVPEELKKEQDKHEAVSSVPGALDFQFSQPLPPESRWFVNNHTIIPKTGDILIFPAMLQHYVLPFKSDITRVSVSGNLKLDRTDLPKDYF